MAYLTDQQRVRVVEHVVAQANGRVPVLAGAIDTTAERVSEQARRLVDVGAEAIVTTCPFYAINDQHEIADHFRRVSTSISVPLFAYDVPVRLNGVKLSPELLVELGMEQVIAGVKDSSGDDVSFRRLVALNRAAGSPLALFTGHECVVDGMLLLGADGAVPGFANVDPGRYAQLWQAAQAGDWERARRVQDEICAEFAIVFVPKGRSGDASGIGAFKTAMQALGIISTNQMAFPVRGFEGELVQQVTSVLKQSGLAFCSI